MQRASVLLECRRSGVGANINGVQPNCDFAGAHDFFRHEELIEHGRSFLSFLATVEPAELDKIGQRLLPHRIIVNQQAELQSASVTERNRTSAIHKGRHRRRTSGKWAQLVSSGRVGSSAETSTEVINQPNTTHQLQPHYSDPQRIYALGNPADSLAPMDPLSRGGEKIIGALLGPSSADRNSGEVEDSDFIQPDAQSISSMAPHSRYMKAFRLLESHYHTRVSKPLGYAEIVSVIKLGDFFFAEKPKAFLSSLQETHTGQTFWHSEFVRPSTDGPVTERLFSSFHCAEILEERSAGDPLRLRMTRVLLYHYFVQLCERSYLSNERRTVGKDKTSTVIDEILKEIYGSDLQEHGSESYKRRKTSIHRHKKIGKRWTLLVGFLGCGVLLLCSNSMSKQINCLSFNEVMIDALVNYLYLAYPRALDLCKKFDEAALSIMKGLPVRWPESIFLDDIEAYSQSEERETQPLTNKWPSLSVINSSIRINLE